MNDTPTVVKRDDRNRLHCEDGPAVEWDDGFKVYAWHGVTVARRVIMSPETVTAEDIQKEPNVEIRRVMIERIGPERYLAIAKAKLVHKDDYGELWSAPRQGDTEIRFVKVVNSTPEPDGTFKDYFLRVPWGSQQPVRKCLQCNKDIAKAPTTARAAVAWTFKVCHDHYNLVMQS